MECLVRTIVDDQFVILNDKLSRLSARLYEMDKKLNALLDAVNRNTVAPIAVAPRKIRPEPVRSMADCIKP